MLTLYYSKSSSALAPHILLDEIGADYETVEKPIAKGAHLAPDYLSINPKGRVPALETPEGVVTENPAILWYLGERFADRGLLPEGPFDRAKAQEINAYICATVHVAFAHKQRGARWSDDPATIEGMKDKVAANLAECAALIEAHYLKGPWVLGERYSICDPYVFLVPRWMAASGVALDGYPKLARHHEAMLGRDATRAVLAAHGL
ncbi:glutathione S-transferase family protein [Aestuariicoccus sp. MJ-SS9]|uniref:glutathione S-transferase family protein n=1 Tax=Aestuariicoccus sp. MJ-SS9 TaxID=3079855 RepID=UPI00290EA021|nr:glutathione S-transferase family protein [Aestuariicoccus sp. MJ-SS9]MDU8913163.1 glutathione S-transferase family protein [Aestuariicoccus sp. MJ-SS9]